MILVAIYGPTEIVPYPYHLTTATYFKIWCQISGELVPIDFDLPIFKWTTMTLNDDRILV